MKLLLAIELSLTFQPFDKYLLNTIYIGLMLGGGDISITYLTYLTSFETVFECYGSNSINLSLKELSVWSRDQNVNQKLL